MVKPFKRVFEKFRSYLDIHTVLSTSGDLLIPTEIYRQGSNTSTFALFYSLTVAYFGEGTSSVCCASYYFPHVLCSCARTIIFALYPFQFFQKFLSLFPIKIESAISNGTFSTPFLTPFKAVTRTEQNLECSTTDGSQQPN